MVWGPVFVAWGQSIIPQVGGLCGWRGRRVGKSLALMTF